MADVLSDSDVGLLSDDEIGVEQQPTSRQPPSGGGAYMSDEDVGLMSDDEVGLAPQAESFVPRVARKIANTAAPAAAGYFGAGAGAEIGGTIGTAIAPGPGTLIGGIVGGGIGALAAGYSASKIQHTVKEATGLDDDVQMAANEAAHPYEQFAVELATGAAGMRPDKAASLAQRGVAAAFGGGLEAGQDYANNGTIDPAKVLASSAVMAALPGENRLGARLAGPGRAVGARVARAVPGRPNTAANPAAAPVQDEAASSQQATVTGESSLQQPPPSAEGDTTGNPQSQPVRSSRAYPKDQAPTDAGPDMLTEGNFSPDVAAALDAFRNAGNTDVGNPRVDVDASLREAPVQTGFPQQAANPNAAKPTLKLKRDVPEPEPAPAAQDVAPRQQEAAPAPENVERGQQILQRLSDADVGLAEQPVVPNPELHESIAGERSGIAQPTAAQAEAGNYAKGHPGRIWKRQFTIETPKGGVREDTKNTPPAWRTENHPTDYGELLGTKGADGDRLDVHYVGTGDKHFVIDQRDPATGKFDEHKIMFAAKDEADALDHYKRAFSDESGERRVGAITPISDEEGIKWVNTPGAKKKPYGDFKEAEGAATPEEAPQAEPKAVTAAVNKMREAGASDADIAKYRALPVGDQLQGAARALRGQTSGEYARPNRLPTKRDYVEGMTDDEGNKIQARSKPDAERKSTDVKTMNDAYERFGEGVELPTTPEEKAALRDRVQQFADDTKGVKYRPNVKHAPYLLQRAAKKLLTAKNPSDASWMDFVGTAKQLASGDVAGVRAQDRAESDIGMNRRSGDEAVTNAESAQARGGVNETEDQMIEALDRARASEGRFDIPHEEAEAMVEPEPATSETIAREAKNTKTLDVSKPADRAELARALSKGGAVGSAKGPVALGEGSTPENPKASAVRNVDVKGLDKDYVKNLLERANKPRSTSRLDADKIVKQTRAASKNSTARQLGEAFLRDEGGALHVDRVVDDIKSRLADMRTFFDNITDMEHKGAKSYRAREPQSEQEKAAFHVAEELQKLRQGDVEHKLGLQQWEKSLPPELKDRKVLERLYYAREAGKINLLDPQEQALYNRHLKPVFDENDRLFENIAELSPGLLGPKVAGDHTYRMVKGAHDVLNQTSDPFDQVAYNAISTSPHDTMLERRFFSMEDAKGNRFLIATNPDGFTVWHNRKPIKVDDPKFAFKEGSQYSVGGRTFTMREATTPEIEQHAMFDAGKRAEYYHNAALSAGAANFQLGAIARHLQLLEGFKRSGAMREFMVPPGTKDAPEGWRETTLKNFDGWKMTPELADAFDNLAQPGFNANGLDTLRKIGSLITKGIFFNPVPHIANVGVHWAVGRGFRWLPTTHNYRALAQTGLDAIKSVLTQDEFYKAAMNRGAGLMYGSVATTKFMDNLAKGLGESIQKEPSKWDPIARQFGVGPSDLVKAVYKASSHMMWAANDMFLIQAIKENMRQGMGMRQAIIESERHIPNYRLPAAVMGSGRGARVFAQAMAERNFFVFGPYHYGVFNEYANIVKDLTKGNGRAKLDAVGHLMVMGALAFAVYPMLDKAAKLITGNPDAEVNRRGAMGIPSHLAKSANAKEDPMSALRSTFTVAPLPEMLLAQLPVNRDWRGKDIVERSDVRRAVRGDPRAAGHVAQQLGGWAAKGAIAPLNAASQIASRPDRSVLGGVRDQFLDIKNPSPASRKFDANVIRRYDQQARQRQKKGEF